MEILGICRPCRYQVGENSELDDSCQVISYEEFSPYGASTYQSRTTKAPRKYRFASYHRDSESGLDLCGERYYTSWLGRWTSADPLGTIDGLNVYAYVDNDPVNSLDPSGTMAKPINNMADHSKRQGNATQPVQTEAGSSSGEEIEQSRYPLAHALQKLGYDALRNSTDLRLNYKKFLADPEKKEKEKEKWVVGLMGRTSIQPVALMEKECRTTPRRLQKPVFWKIRLDYDPSIGRHVNSQFGERKDMRKIAFQDSTDIPQAPPEISVSRKISTPYVERAVGRLEKPKGAKDIHTYDYESAITASLGHPGGLPTEKDELMHGLVRTVHQWFSSILNYKDTYDAHMQRRMEAHGMSFTSYQNDSTWQSLAIKDNRR